MELIDIRKIHLSLFGDNAHSIVLEGLSTKAPLPLDLLPQENSYLQHMAAQRQREWAASRVCARIALKKIGAADNSIAVGSGQPPQWPLNVVGSITHTRDHAFVAVACKSRRDSIGIDAEFSQRLLPKLWAKVFVPEEMQWLSALPQSIQYKYATTVFSIKEAFYKYQYPLTQAWVGFQDAQVQPILESCTEIELKLLKSIGAWPAGQRFKGRYVWSGPYVFSAFC